MPRRGPVQRRTATRQLALVTVIAGVLATAMGLAMAPRLIEGILIDQLRDDLTHRVTALSALIETEWADGESADLQTLIELSGLSEVAVFAPAEGGEGFQCIAASDSGWIDREAANFVTRLELGSNFEALMTAAAGVPQLAEGGRTAETVVSLPSDLRVYAALTADRVAERMSFLWWKVLWRGLLITAVAGGLALLALRVLIVGPLRRLRMGAEAIAARRDIRLQPEGPAEVRAICTAITALAAETEGERRHSDDEARRWRSLFDKIPSPAFIFASGGQILEVNEEAQRTLECDRESLLQRRRDDLCDGPETLNLPGGENMPVHWVEAPLEHDGRPALFAVALDLRSIRQAEAQMKHLGAVLDQVDQMIFEVSDEGEIEACNIAACRGVGEGVEALRSRPLAEVFSGEPALPSWSEVKRGIFNHGVWRGDVRPAGEESDESLVQLELKTFPPGGILAVGRPIGAVRSLEGDLEEQQSVAALGAVAVCGTRDLRRSIQAIQTYTAHLVDLCEGDPEIAAGLNSIETSVRRASELLRHQRAFSRTEIFDLQEAEINGIVQRTVTTPELFRDRHMSVTLDLDDQIPPVPSEPQFLGMALRALTGALRGNSHLVVTTQCDAMEPGQDMAGKRARLILHGEGKGMTEDEARHAFDACHLVPGEDAVHSVPFAAGVIHLLGGEIILRNEPGVCTTIEIALPLSRDEVTRRDGPPPPVEVGKTNSPLTDRATDEQVEDLIAEPVGEEAPPAVPLQLDLAAEEIWEDESEGPGEMCEPSLFDAVEDKEEDEEDEDDELVDDERALGGTPALLMIDDEEIVLDLVRDIFEDEDFEVITAADVDEAVQRMRECGDRIFMAVIDLQLGGDADGWEVARRLSEIAPGLPIHIASGYQTEEQDIPAECAGVIRGLVRKPFRAGALRDLILETLAQR